MPGNFKIDNPMFVSPDKKKIFFVGNISDTSFYIFCCNIDGSNVTQLINLGSEGHGYLQGAY
jgi:hypothetical protein